MEDAEKQSHRLTTEIVVRFEAKLEIEEAHQYYKEIEEKLGADFLGSIEIALNFASQNPLAQPIIYKNTRRILVTKFPYAVFYICENQRIVVLACCHQRRKMSDFII